MATKTNAKYEANDGDIHQLLMEPERFAAAGTPPTGEINNKIKAKTSKTNREHGLRPRGVTLARVVGTAPDTFRKYSFLPVLTLTAWGSAAFAVGATITIGSISWEVVGQVPEDY